LNNDVIRQVPFRLAAKEKRSIHCCHLRRW